MTTKTKPSKERDWEPNYKEMYFRLRSNLGELAEFLMKNFRKEYQGEAVETAIKIMSKQLPNPKTTIEDRFIKKFCIKATPTKYSKNIHWWHGGLDKAPNPEELLSFINKAIQANDRKWIKKIDKLINSLKKLPDDETMTKKPVILELQVLKDTLLTTK